MVTHVNQGTNLVETTDTLVITMDGTTSVGDLLVLALFFSNEGRTISSITGLGSWAEMHALQTQVGIGGLVIYGCRCTSAGTTITITLSGASGVIQGWCREFKYAPATFAETGSSTAFNSTGITDFTVAAVTPVSAQCVFLGIVAASGNGTPWTDDGDFTYFEQSNTIRAAYRIQTGTAAQSFANTSTASLNGLGMLVAFEATDAGPSSSKNILLLGVG